MVAGNGMPAFRTGALQQCPAVRTEEPVPFRRVPASGAVSRDVCPDVAILFQFCKNGKSQNAENDQKKENHFFPVPEPERAGNDCVLKK